MGDLVRGLKGERKMMDGWIGRRGEGRTKSINQIKSRIQELLAVKSPARTNKKRIFFGLARAVRACVRARLLNPNGIVCLRRVPKGVGLSFSSHRERDVWWWWSSWS